MVPCGIVAAVVLPLLPWPALLLDVSLDQYDEITRYLITIPPHRENGFKCPALFGSGNYPCLSISIDEPAAVHATAGNPLAGHADAVIAGPLACIVMPDLHEVFTRDQIGDDLRVAPLPAIIILRNESSFAVGAKQLHDHIGLPAGLNGIATCLGSGESIHIFFAGLTDIGGHSGGVDDWEFDRLRSIALGIGQRAGNESLIHCRQIFVGVGPDTALRPGAGEGIEHNGVGIKLGPIDLILTVFLDHIVAGLFGAPKIRRPGQVPNHHTLIPLNSALRVLMFVPQATAWPNSWAEVPPS